MWQILLTLGLIGRALSTPANDLVIHEKRSGPSTIGKRAIDKNSIVPLRIALTQSNLENGYDYLADVSDPRSTRYGQHWTTDQIHSTFSPSTDTMNAVIEWLDSHGFHEHGIAKSASNGWLGIDMTVADVERLLSTEYYIQRDDDGNFVLVCDEYHLPAHLTGHIDYITPGVMASAPLRTTKRLTNAPPNTTAFERRSQDKIPEISPYDTSSCGKWITPICYQALYDIPNATLNQPENSLGIFGSYTNTYDQKDLDLYFSNYAPWVPNGTHPLVESINGAKAPVSEKDARAEGILDLDISYALLYPQDITLYQMGSTLLQQKTWIQQYGATGNLSEVIYFLPFIDAVDGKLCTEAEKRSGVDCGTIENLTKVLSVSYGASELQCPERAAKRICSEFMKLALKGHTILSGSGDWGVGQNPPFTSVPSLPWTNGCINPKITDRLANGTVFNPTFPASCPFITAVGGSQLVPGETVEHPERAFNVHENGLPEYPNIYSISSGGGRSNFFPMPEYQKCAVEEYFSAHNPGYPTYEYEGLHSVGKDGGLYARRGRGIPDLAANAAHMAQFSEGDFIATGQAGTSLATPIVASIITMINQQRTLAGKGPVGFINPVIYQHPEAFNDVTHGKNPGCGTEGFPAATGWDPITGLGTPNYPKLLEVFMALP